MKTLGYLFVVCCVLCSVRMVAQSPLADATVTTDDIWDGFADSKFGLKVRSTVHPGRVMVVKDAVLGVDDLNRIRFQLFTDGTLHLYNDAFQETITLDGLNGQILVHGMGINVNGKWISGMERPGR